MRVDDTVSLRIAGHARPGQQFVCTPPARQRSHPLQPYIYRGMAGCEIIPGFLVWVLEISDHRQVHYGWPLTNHEGSVRQLLLQNRKEIIQPLFQKLSTSALGEGVKTRWKRYVAI